MNRQVVEIRRGTCSAAKAAVAFGSTSQMRLYVVNLSPKFLVSGLQTKPKTAVQGQSLPKHPDGSVRFARSAPQNRRTAPVKSFGRREAYESPRRTNPRAPGSGLWGFRFQVDLVGAVTGRRKGPACCGGAVLSACRAVPREEEVAGRCIADGDFGEWRIRDRRPKRSRSDAWRG
jgi:hypothetical protein